MKVCLCGLETGSAPRKPHQRLRWFSLLQIGVFPDDGDHRYLIRFRSMLAFSRALLGLVLFGPFLLSGTVRAAVTLSVEAFTTTEFLISGKGDQRLQGAKLAVYFVDGLEQIETALSQDLPIQAEDAKAESLRRIEGLNDAGIAPAKNAAIGLAKAVQYGVDRHPAIVFDERAIVYGLTDLVEALDHYEAWQREQTR